MGACDIRARVPRRPVGYPYDRALSRMKALKGLGEGRRGDRLGYAASLKDRPTVAV
jgi:hypothetical protein